MENYGRFYEVFKRVPCKGDREEMKELFVEQCTNNRTKHLHEMTEGEYLNLCRTLERMFPDPERKEWKEVLRMKRSAILKLMQKVGVNTTDWDMINSFCENTRIAGKSFRSLNPEELDELGRKLRAIEKKGGLRKHETIIIPVSQEQGKG